MSVEFYWVAVVATTILSVARLSRLFVIDKFPPIKSLRDRYEARTDGSDWQLLAMCAFCMAPWVTLFVGGTGLLAGVYDPSAYGTLTGAQAAWWVFNGWLAVAYLAASYVARDGATTEDD